jgi:pantetheine-phosphate adenylyltransferase
MLKAGIIKKTSFSVIFMAKKYRKVAVGGTFDLLHKGHVHLLRKALEVGEFVIIGLTSDEMLRAYPKSHCAATFEDRKRELTCFLTKDGALEKVQIVPLNDPYGTVTQDETVEALVISYETDNRYEEINDFRRQKGFKPLQLIVIDAILAEDGFPISTTRIRRGEIDRKGRLCFFDENTR